MIHPAIKRPISYSIVLILTMLFVLSFGGQSSVSAQTEPQIAFEQSFLSGLPTIGNPTTLQFGPDNRLYLAERHGEIYAITIVRNGPGDYIATDVETIDLIWKEVINHNDVGQVDTTNQFIQTNRQVTGLVATGTAANPVLYVSSSDPREGGGSAGTETNLDTNSGVVSRLTWNGTAWEHLQLVRGLPRSEENHSVNGMVLNEATNTLYLAVGGFTNMGAPSFNFTYIPEYAYSAAIVSIDLNAIGNTTYDLPTLDDPTRPNNPDGSDVNDPFGGNDGLNQARIDPNGPVQIYASGFRNPYDIVLTESGNMYSIDNGPNYTWGGPPINESLGQCDNTPNDNSSETHYDNLHFITGKGFYGGHPAPTRANPQGIFGTEADSPVPFALANPVECDYREPGVDDGALATWVTSTNGITEYTATNFFGAMQGDLLTVSYDGDVYRIKPDSTGAGLVDLTPNDPGDWGYESLFTGFGTVPLDITAQGDNDIFPGTLWVAVFVDKTIAVFEPTDFPCTGDYDALLDEDGDGYDNADEIDNGTNPCSNGSKPPDHDKDLTSDLNDPDDDNDGISDLTDVFQIDPQNGVQTTLPVRYDFFQDNPGTGFFGVGFTGLMTNGVTDYLDMYTLAELTVGGTAGKATVDNFTDGTAFGVTNTQDYAFQWGVNVTQADGTFGINSQINGTFFQPAPEPGDTQGIYFGTGDQDNYLQLALAADDATGDIGFEVIVENAGTPTRAFYPAAGAHLSTQINLYMTIDPVAGTVQPKYDLDDTGFVPLGAPIVLTGDLLDVVQTNRVMAVGLIANFASGSTPFGGTWDYVFIEPEQPGILGATPSPANFGNVVQGTFVDETITLRNLGQAGDPDIIVSSMTINGNADYSIISGSVPQTIAPGATSDVVVRYQPDTLETDTATLDIVHDGTNSPLSINLTGNGIVDYDPIYRVNIGGGELSDPEGVLNWSADNGTNPSPYANHAISGSTLTSTGSTIDYSSPTLPSYTPAMLFNTGRWDPNNGAENEMIYEFPVDDGSYEVRLYFAEIFSGTASVGARVYDAELEGIVPVAFDDIDRFALAGFEAGYMLAAETEVSDGALTVRFLHQKENPELQGIEIYPLFVPPSSDLGVSAAQMDFGGVSVGVASEQTLTLTNTGTATDPTITINGLSYSGTHAADFSDNFSAPVTLQPGDSTDVIITMNASDAGTRTATLTIDHDGDNAPTTVDLSGTAYQSGALALSPASLDFGQVQLGSSNTLPLTLTNLGGLTDADITVTDLVVTGANTYQFQFAPYTEPLIVPAAQSVTVDVTFTPQAAGTYDVTISVAHDGTNSPVSIPATAQGTETAPTAAAILRIETGGDMVTSSTYNPSFYIENASTDGQQITSVSFEISSAIVPDVVFDPLGTAGDSGGRCLYPESNSAATVGFVAPADLCVDPFFDPYEGGYNGITASFNDFQVGESFLFGVDIDPISTKGTAPPGPDHAASVSGYELLGSVVTVEFSDGSTLTSQLWRYNTSNTGSFNRAQLNSLSAPTIDVLGVAAPPTTVSDLNQIIRVTGNPGDQISLLISEGEMVEQAGGGYDVDPFEINTVLNIAEYTATIGADGTVDVPVTLLDDELIDGVYGGKNYIAAVVRDGTQTSNISNRIVLEYVAPTIDIVFGGNATFAVQEGQTLINGDSISTSTSDGSTPTINLTAVDDTTGTTPTWLLIPATVTAGDLVSVDLDVVGLAPGTHTATVTGAASGYSSGTFTVTVTVNDITINVSEPTEGQNIPGDSLTVTWTSTGGLVDDHIHLTLDDLATTGVEPHIGSLPQNDTYTFTGIAAGYYQVIVEMANVNHIPYQGDGVTQRIDVSIGLPDQPPIVTNPGDQTNTEGDSVSLPIEATDPEGQALNYSATGLPDGLSIDANTGIISGTLTSAAPTNSPFAVTVTVSDGGLTSDVTFNWTVNALPTGPQVTDMALIDVASSTAVRTLVDGDTVNLGNFQNGISVQANTSGDIAKIEFKVNGAVERTEGIAPYTIAGDNSGNYNQWNVAPGTYTITATPTNNPAGALTLTISIVDGATNLPPNVTNPGDQASVEENTVSLQINASDPEAQPLTYSATGLPTGLSINSSTGVISGTVATGASTNSPYGATVTVSDGTTPVNVVFSWTVAPVGTDFPPNVTNPGDQSSVEENTVSLQINASDPEAQPLTYSATGLPTGLSINSSTGLISGTVATGASTNSSYSVTVTVSDGTTPVDVTFSWLISPPTNLPPSVTNPGNQASVEENTVSLQINASDPEAQPLTYSATGLPTGLSINSSTGLISGTVATGASTNSPYSVTVTVSDSVNPVNVSFSWTITAPTAGPLVVDMSLIDVASGTAVRTLTEGDTVNLGNFQNGISVQANTVGTISQVEFKVNGVIERTESVAPYTIAGDGNGNYNEWNVTPGTYTITATPKNNPAGALTVTISITEPTVDLPPSVTNPGNQSNVEEDAVSLQINASDPEGQPLTYSAVGLPAGVSINSSTGLISGTVATGASTGSPYSVTISVTDGVNPVNVSFSWTVAEAGTDLPPTVTNPGSQSSVEENAVSLQINASDPEAQALSYSATGLPAGLSINSSTGLISGTVATGASTGSPYSVTVTVTDGTTPVSITFSWTITVPTAGPQVTELVLIDVATGSVVRTLTADDVVTLSNYANGISIQANTSGTISQVEFTVNGAFERTEGVAPYTIAGDNAGNYNQWNATPGSNTITATPLNNPAGALTLTITINS